MCVAPLFGRADNGGTMATTKKNTKPAKARPQLNRQTIKDLSVSGGLDRGVKGGMLPPTKGCPMLPPR